jgi:hypothetical protein
MAKNKYDPDEEHIIIGGPHDGTKFNRPMSPKIRHLWMSRVKGCDVVFGHPGAGMDRYTRSGGNTWVWEPPVPWYIFTPDGIFRHESRSESGYYYVHGVGYIDLEDEDGSEEE